MPDKKKLSPRERKRGLPPGSLVYTGDSQNLKTRFILHQYDESNYEFYEESALGSAIKRINGNEKSWLQIVGINNIEHFKNLGQIFHISPLVLEDILDVSHRPKCNVFNDYIFFTLKSLSRSAKEDDLLQYHQISFILTDKLLISFQEDEEKWLADFILRLNQKVSTLREKSIDYLFYRMLDTIVDYYLVELENLEEQIEDLELKINDKIEDEDILNIQQLKRDLITLRKNISPLRGAISVVKKEDRFLTETVIHNLSDVYEHTIHIIETIETYRDLSSALMDLYMTGASNKMNEIMKVLTIISTIFIPLTFIAGVYGMNFQYMPELDWDWAYPATMFLMVLIALAMIIYFRKKKWL